VKYKGEPIIPDPSFIEVAIATAKVKKYKSPIIMKFQNNCFKQEAKHCGISSITNQLIAFGRRKTCLISGKSVFFYHLQQSR
jgi:hypothetical protein